MPRILHRQGVGAAGARGKGPLDDVGVPPRIDTTPPGRGMTKLRPASFAKVSATWLRDHARGYYRLLP